MTARNCNSSGNILTRIFSGLDLFGKKRRAEKKESERLAARKKSLQKVWNECIPFTPNQTEEILKRDLPTQTKISFNVSNKSNITFYVEADGIFKHQRNCNFITNISSQGNMRVEKREHEQGYGRIIMRNGIEFYRACGIQKLEITAGNEAGGYVWARMGFLPSQITPELRGELHYRWEKLETFLTEEEIRSAHRSHTERSPFDFRVREDLWHIADLRIDMGSRLRDLFKNAAQDKRAANLAEELENCYNVTEISLGRPRMTFDLQQDLSMGRVMPLGRLLLMGTQWPGYLDFNNETQMARVEKYVGGWKGVPAPAIRP